MSAMKTKTGKVMDLLTTLTTGESFLTDKTASQVTAYAVKMKAQCKTQKVLVIEDYKGVNPKTKVFTKVIVS